MPIYVIAVVPLLLIVLEIMTTENKVKMAAYADDFTASGIKSLKRYWDTLCRVGSKFGYFLEAKNSWLFVVKFLKDLSLMKFFVFFWKTNLLHLTNPILNRVIPV